MKIHEALQDLRTAIELLGREQSLTALAAITDRLTAMARDDPSNIYLAAILHATITVRDLSANPAPDARERVDVAMRTLRIVATAWHIGKVEREP